MKKLNKKELVNHVKDIDRNVSNIYFDLTGNKELSTFKLNNYISQLDLLTKELMATLNSLNEASKKELLLLVLSELLDAILTIVAVISLFFNFTLGMILLSICSVISFSAFRYLHNPKNNLENKLSEEELYKLKNTFNNCFMLLKKRLSGQKPDFKQGKSNENYKFAYANDLIQIHLYITEPVFADQEIKDIMIKILQEDLKTEEGDLTKLLDMARNVSFHEPFSLDNNNDVLILTRKSKQSN